MSSPFPQFRAKLLILLLPILRNPERITDFLDGLAIDIVFQVVYLKPRIHHFRLVDGKLRNEPALRHLDIVGFIIVHKRQKLRGVPLAQPGDKFQFMRNGYFCADTHSKPDELIFNRTVQLRDSFNAKK